MAATGLVLTLALVAGCVSLGPFTTSDQPAPAPVCQVVTTWCHEVMFAPDPVHNGTPTPGLAGRLYLFGPEIGYPLVGDGSVTVDLFDEGTKAAGGAPVLLEEWRIDHDTLHRLLKRDTIGWGYTLFLPWGTYKPEISCVRLKLRYEPLKGSPLFSESGALTLNRGPDAGAAVMSRVAKPAAAESHGVSPAASKPPAGTVDASARKTNQGQP